MKKKILKFILYGIPLSLIIFQFITIFILVFYLDSELIEKIVVTLMILMVISVIIMVYGLNKIGFVSDEINKKFKKCKVYKIIASDYNEFEKSFEAKVKKIDYKEYTFDGKSIVRFYVNRIENNLNIIALIKAKEYNSEIYNSVLELSTQFIESLYGNDEVNEYIKLVRILCVEKITKNFKEFVLEGLSLGINYETISVGISFGSKKLFLKRRKKILFDFYNKVSREIQYENQIVELLDIKEVEKTLIRN